jgi:two-component system sensor kinase FixL
LLEMMRRRQAFVTMDVAIAIAAAVFVVDLLTNLQGAIAVLYIAIPLILASAYSERVVLAAAVGCGALSTIAFLWQHLRIDDESADTRFGVSIAALAVTTFLALRQKRSAAELERSERRYRAIFHAAGFPTWESDWSQVRRHFLDAMSDVTMDKETWLLSHPEVVRKGALLSVIRDLNQAAINMLEASSADELVGANITSELGGLTVGAEPGFGRLIAGLLEGKDTVEVEIPSRTIYGRRLDIILRAARIREDEPWSRLLFMAFDETERKEARAKLEQASADLAHAARVSMLGQLSASIAHEVSQPLAAMVAYAGSGKQWLRRDEPDLREAELSFDEIVKNGSRAAGVIERIRSLTRKAPAVMERVDLPKLVNETVALVAHHARAAGVIIVRDEERGVPAVWADRVQVQQVLVNLLLNGIQAMRHVDDRERQLTIKLGNGENGMLQVEVCDAGTGISDLSGVFAPFFTTKGDGMGMGLSISRSIVEAHGGSIQARNNPDFGATFCFALPSVAATELEDDLVQARS